MSNFPNNSYPVPRDLEKDEYFTTARPLWKLVMYWLLSHSVYKDELAYDINGSIAILKRGQVAFTLRQIAEELNIDKNDVDAAILHFSGYTTKRKINSLMAAGKRPILFRQESRQEVRQEKSVCNIMWKGYFIECQTEKQTEKQTGGQTESRQKADINKKDKKEKKAKEEDSLSKDNSSSTPPQSPEKGKGGGVGKMAYKHNGPISEDAYRLSEETIRLKITCSADRIQQWIEELDGRSDLVEQEIRDVGDLKATGTKIITGPGFIGFRIANIKSTFRPTIGRRIESNREYAERHFGMLELEGYQRIHYGVDLITIKHAKQQFQIFYASPTFQKEVEDVKKFLDENRKKIVNIKEA